MFSALLRGVPSERASRVALVGGIAVARAVEQHANVVAGLKWPNDVRIGGRKVCGMIGELAPSGEYVVLGIGVNVGHAPGELPDELDATSIRIASGTAPRRDDLCASILRELDTLVDADDFMDEYRRRCETIGTEVRVELAGGKVEGVATAVRDDGALMVGDWAVVAGDVVHVRTA
jgi:BirA family biotin operon repressor/biotin-[acetyl-CoA-carboxylase] ligase